MSSKKYQKTVEKTLDNLFRLELALNSTEEEANILKKELKGLKIELNDYERDCTSIGVESHSNGISKTVENKIIRKEKIKEKLIPEKRIQIYNKLIKKENEEFKINRIKRAIDNLKPSQREIIKMFYIEKKSIEDICGKLHREQSQVFLIKKRAIKALSFELWGVEALEEELPLLKIVKTS